MKSDVKKIHKHEGTSRSLKRGVSLLLSLLMLVGIFTALPLSVSAAEEDGATANVVEETTETSSDDINVESSDKSASESAAISSSDNNSSEQNEKEDNKLVDKKKAKKSTGAKVNKKATGENVEGVVNNNISFVFNQETGTLTFSGTGPMDDWETRYWDGDPEHEDDTNYGRWVTNGNPEWRQYFYDTYSVQNIVIGNGITKIGCDCFGGFWNLTSVSFPSSLTSIGDRTFYGCNNLTSVTIPSNVQYIGEQAFYSSGLNEFPTISKGCYVAHNAFEWCENIRTYSCGSSAACIYESSSNTLTVFGSGYISQPNCYDYDLQNSVTNIVIHNGITSIESYAFSNYSSLTNVSVPESVSYIDSYAFEGVYNANISGNYMYDIETHTLTAFGTGALYKGPQFNSMELMNWQYDVETIVIKNGVTEIGSVFSNLPSLSTVVIPESVQTIQDYAFAYTGLTELPTIPETCSYTRLAFAGCNIVIPLNYECDYNSNTNTLTISGTGALATDNNGDYLWNDNSDNIRHIVINDGITEIGAYVFSNITNLASVSLPQSMTEINSYAFNGLHNIESFSVANGNSVYDSRNNCNAIIETATNTLLFGAGNTTIPNTVTAIGDSAFSGCQALQSIAISDSVITIGESAFSGCLNLTSVTIGSGVTTVGRLVFNGCAKLTSFVVSDENTTFDSRNNCNALIRTSNNELVLALKCSTIPNTTRSIGTEAFRGSGVTSITIPNSVTSIGNNAFYKCTKLTSITIPNSVTSIGNYAFNDCTKLASIIIPDSVTYIGTGILTYTRYYNNNSNWENNSLYVGNHLITTKSISGSYVVKNNTKTIASGAFSRKESLTDVIIPDSVVSICDGAFEYCTNLTDVTIPDGLTYIGEMAFANCSSLTEIVIPDGVTDIGRYTFYECTSLENAVIGDGVTSIGNSAFTGCSNLSDLTVGNSVTSIGDEAFKDCSAITSVILPDSVEIIKYLAFAYCNNATLVFSNGDIDLNQGHYFMGTFYGVKRLAVPVDSRVYTSLTYDEFTRYRPSTTEVIGIVSNDQQFASVFNSSNDGKGVVATGSKKSKIATGAKTTKASTSATPTEERLTAEQKAEILSHIRCYLVDDVEIDEKVTFNSNNDIVFHLNEFSVDSDGDLVDSTPHTLEGSTNGALIEVPGDLIIKTTGEGQGGIINDSGSVFDVKNSGSLTIENGVYSEDVSEYIADSKVMGKTGNRYTVLNPSTTDLELEDDGRQVIMPENQDTFARNDFVGVQMRNKTATISEGMRFVSVVRSDILRGAKDYGFVLAKGRNVETLRSNKDDILADSGKCFKISAKNTSNSLADTAYSSSNLNEGKYKYLTAAITDIDDDNIAIGARLYIERQDGTYVYADYTCVSTMGEIKAMAA